MQCGIGCTVLLGIWLMTARIGLAETPALRWVRHLDDAKKIAVEEHKDLLVNFTGLEWCGHCIDLDAEILSQPEFAASEKYFVLVDIDLPSQREELGELEELYNAWLKQYFIHGLPTVMLADAAGRPYAYFTGYEVEKGIATFMREITEARQSCIERDRAFTAARSAVGAERAQKLHEGLQCIAARMETLEEREDDDPILFFYKDEVEQIRSLDADGALQLRQLYDNRTAARDAYRQQQALFTELRKYNAKEEWTKAIAHVDRALGEATDPVTRYRLKEQRCNFLDWSNQDAEALASFRELRQDPNCPADERKQLVRDEAVSLYRLGRLDEALALYDREISAAADRPKDRLFFLDEKMNLLLGADRDEDAIAACRAVQAAVPPNSKTWAQATANLAWTYEHAGQYQEAIAASRESYPFWQKRGDTSGLSVIARLQHKLGDDAGARRTLDEFASTIPERADRPAKQKKIDRMREELEEVRAMLAESDAIPQPGAK